MDRRKFLLGAGLLSATVAAVSGTAEAHNQSAPTHRVARQGKFVLSNGYLAWELEWKQGKLGNSVLHNKLTGHTFHLSTRREFRLVFSASKHRVEIPWWDFVFGPDELPVPPDAEKGLALGYQQPDFRDQDWGKTENLLLRSLRGVNGERSGITYDGYGWFRSGFELPHGLQGEPVVFVLGGYDQLDWNEYWVYLNGLEIGHRLSSGRWRTPGRFVVPPGTSLYSSIRFGSEAKNLLAVRTRGYDKHFGGLNDEVLQRYDFEPVLVDQIISAGEPYLEVSDLELRGMRQEGTRRVVLELRSPALDVSVTGCYELEGAARRKWVELTNTATRPLLLLDVGLDELVIDAATSEGGYGEPIIGEEMFCAIEHPAGLNQADQGNIKLMHFPAKELRPGDSFRSHTALIAVTPRGRASEEFISYIQDRSPRKKKAIAIFDPFGINNQWGACPTLNDLEILDGLQVLEKWQEKGLRFDYYVPDTGWHDHASDLTRFAPQCFPEGVGKVVERLNSLGMKFGLWFAVTWGEESCSEYPPIWASQIPAPGEPSEPGRPPMVYRNGYLEGGGAQARLCLASEPFFSILRNAILHHIRKNNLRFFKLDGGMYYCNSTHHCHLPGKYSVEASYDCLIDIATSARKEAPDVYVMWYWGVRSPFFGLHGDSIFESGLAMEGSGTSWYPTLYYRDSVTLNVDVSTQFAKSVPPLLKDSLGVWLADTRWGNYMGTERWREALVMDLGRGNLLFPQLWGNIYSLSEDDVDFLVYLTSLVKKNERLFLRRRNILGDPWKNEVYGYANCKDGHGFFFINNVHFAPRKAELPLGSLLGLTAGSATPVTLTSHFPQRKQIARQDGSGFKASDVAEVWLRPFEVLMLEASVGPQPSEQLRVERLSPARASDMGSLLSLAPGSRGDWMEVQFADEARFEKQGKEKRVYSFSTQLPSLERESILAVVVRLRRGNEEWRYAPVVVEIVQVVARIGEESTMLVPVPDSRQFGNSQGEGCSWIVYKVRTTPSWSNKELQFAVNAYLPAGVHAEAEAWVVRKWWEERTRPMFEGFFGNAPS